MNTDRAAEGFGEATAGSFGKRTNGDAGKMPSGTETGRYENLNRMNRILRIKAG